MGCEGEIADVDNRGDIGESGLGLITVNGARRLSLAGAAEATPQTEVCPTEAKSTG